MEFLSNIDLIRDALHGPDAVLTVAAAAAAVLLAAAATVYMLRVHGDGESARIKKMTRCLPGPSTLPLLGNTHQVGLLTDGQRLYQIRTWARLYPHVHSMWIGPMPSAAVYTPSGIAEILKSSKHSGKGFSYKFLHEWLGTGLLTSAGPKWKARRRMITPSFHFEVLRGFVTTFAEQADIMVTLLKKEADSGKYFDMFPYITRAALDIICDSAMGQTVHAQGSTENAYVTAVYDVSRSTFNRTLQPWNWNQFIYTTFNPTGRSYARNLKVLHDFTKNVIAERRARRSAGTTDTATDEAGQKKKQPFLDMLLDARDDDGQPLTDADIQEEVDTFMFEGHDTTSAGVAWTFTLVGAHLDVQRKLQEEIDRVLGSRLLPTFEDLQELHYLEMVLKESLRLHPSVPIIARILDEDVNVDGHVLPRGLQVAVMIFAAHLDPDIWGADAEEFRPERFSAEESAGRNMYAYVPFSAGPRNCIGQKFALLEERMLVASVLRNFDVVRDPDCVIEPRVELILRPSTVPVKLRSRVVGA